MEVNPPWTESARNILKWIYGTLVTMRTIGLKRDWSQQKRKF